MQTIETMDYAQLKSLRDDVDGLMHQRRQEALEDLKVKAAALDFPIDEIFGRLNGKAPKYRNPENAAETYGGKGKRPAWLQAKLDDGHAIDEFKV